MKIFKDCFKSNRIYLPGSQLKIFAELKTWIKKWWIVIINETKSICAPGPNLPNFSLAFLLQGSSQKLGDTH